MKLVIPLFDFFLWNHISQPEKVTENPSINEQVFVLSGPVCFVFFQHPKKNKIFRDLLKFIINPLSVKQFFFWPSLQLFFKRGRKQQCGLFKAGVVRNLLRNPFSTQNWQISSLCGISFTCFVFGWKAYPNASSYMQSKFHTWE